MKFIFSLIKRFSGGVLSKKKANLGSLRRNEFNGVCAFSFFWWDTRK